MPQIKGKQQGVLNRHPLEGIKVLTYKILRMIFLIHRSIVEWNWPNFSLQSEKSVKVSPLVNLTQIISYPHPTSKSVEIDHRDDWFE